MHPFARRKSPHLHKPKRGEGADKSSATSPLPAGALLAQGWPWPPTLGGDEGLRLMGRCPGKIIKQEEPFCSYIFKLRKLKKINL